LLHSTLPLKRRDWQHSKLPLKPNDSQHLKLRLKQCGLLQLMPVPKRYRGLRGLLARGLAVGPNAHA